ncbi:MAG TPA: AmmeMemoRadiSam system radical SAM enzyme [Kaistiaceae bacterium]|nr:AmmeMemoRadiSam system radical SAM enzyme [Kaistiaceae bacterium]
MTHANEHHPSPADAGLLDGVEPENIVPTKYWRMLDDGRVECRMCPRFCKLKEGARGLCFVRARLHDAIVLTTWGRSSGFCIDPVEKKPLNHFLPGTSILSLGTAGCNLACNFCQNHDISKSREMDTMQAKASPEAIARAAEHYGCRSVAFTYNDPVIFHEYARDISDACHERGIRTVAVTAGYVSDEARADFFEKIDAANVDLKAFTERFYREVTKSELEVVLDTLKYLRHETNVWFEITNLVIPGSNDSDAEIDAMTRWIVGELGPDVPLHFSAFHPDYRMRDKSRTPAATLARARQVAMENGVRHAYVGNVADYGRQSSYCHACGTRTIGREGYEILEWNLDDHGVCTACGTPMAGIFEGPPGNWGSRRQPVDLTRFA